MLRFIAVTLVLAAALSSASLAAQAQTPLGLSTPFTAPITPTTMSIAVADLFGSSVPEIVALDGAFSTVIIVSNASGGGAPTTITLAVDAAPRWVTTGDLDLDGDVDIVTRNNVSISVLTQTTPAVFSRIDLPTLPSGNAGTAPTIIDMNLDGIPDVMLGTSVYQGTAGQGLAAPVTLFTNLGASAAPHGYGDFDGDGLPDIVQVREVSGTSYVKSAYFWKATAPLVFAASPVTTTLFTSVTAPTFFGQAAFADMNADGRIDIVFGAGGNASAAMTATFLGTTTGAFTAIGGAPNGIAPRSEIALADADLDGDLDVACELPPFGYLSGSGAASAGPTSAAWLLNDGTNRFAVGAITTISYPSLYLNTGSLCRTGDFDQDGLPDVLHSVIGRIWSSIAFTSLNFAVPATVQGTPPYTLQILSADPAIAAIGGAFPPFELRLTDSLGAPIVGARVSFASSLTTLSPSPVSQSIPDVFTDPTGRATTTILGPGLQTTFTVTATATTSNGTATAIGTFNTGPITAQKISGDQIIDLGDPIAPVVARIVDHAGAPIAYAPAVIFTAMPNNVGNTTDTVLADAQGYIIVHPAFGAIGGMMSIGVTPVGVTTGISFTIFARYLAVNGPSVGGQTAFLYTHDHAGQSIILAADAPGPLTPTPYGTLATSILSPQPTFVALTSLVGSPFVYDPGLVANPTFVRVVTVPASLAGQSLVFQVVGFDAALWPDPQAIFISNAVTKTF